MSSGPLLILMALTTLLTVSGGSLQTSQSDSISDLLLRDDVDRADELLRNQSRTAETIAYQGEIEFRRGNFAKADAFYRESLEMNEKIARAHFGLGKLALSKLKSKEALTHLKRAIELDPSEALFHLYAGEAYGVEKNYEGQKAELQQYVKLNPADPDRMAEAKAALEVIDALGKDMGVIESPDTPLPLPFKTTLNLIFTQVMINGKGPYSFVIDTGATQVVLSEKVATELGLKPITTTIMHGVGGGGRVESKLYKVNELSAGQVKIRNLPVGTFTDPLVTQLADGILGTAVLSDFFVSVNYPESRLELSKTKPAVTDEETLPARYFSNLLLVPLEVNGKFQGNFVVDTGAVTTVLSHSMAAKLGVTEDTPGAKVDLGLAGVGGMEGVVLRVSNVTFKTLNSSDVFHQVVAIDLKNISKMIGTEVSGVIGYDFLDAFKVVLDYSSAEVHLVK